MNRHLWFWCTFPWDMIEMLIYLGRNDSLPIARS